MKQRDLVVMLLLFSGIPFFVEAQTLPPQRPTNIAPMPTPSGQSLPVPASSAPPPPTPSTLPSPAREMPPATEQVKAQPVVVPVASQTPPEAEMSTNQQSQVQGTSGAAEKQTVVDVGGNLKIVPKVPTTTTTIIKPTPSSQTTSITTTPAVTTTTPTTTTTPIVTPTPIRRTSLPADTTTTPVTTTTVPVVTPVAPATTTTVPVVTPTTPMTTTTVPKSVTIESTPTGTTTTTTTTVPVQSKP